MDPDRARTELPPVPDQVVMLAEGRTGIGLDQVLMALDGAREGVMNERPLARVLVFEEQRKVEDPEDLVARLVHELELLAEVEPESTEHPLHQRGGVRDEENGRTGHALKRFELALRQELGDRRADLARLVEDEIREALGAPLLRELLQPLQLSARERLRRHDEPYRLRAREDSELGTTRDFRCLLDLQPETHVRLVGAVTQHRLGVRHPREGPFRRRAADRFERRDDHLLQDVEDILACREGELEVELPELELPIRA